MSRGTKIQWTDETWNPIVGCKVISPGCTHCYAMRIAGHRLDGNSRIPHYAGTTQTSKAGPVWSGKIALAPEHVLTAPLSWRRPRTIFVNSMGDLFHENVPDSWIDRVFAIMALSPHHTFQVLTKRAERMRNYFADCNERSISIGCALGDLLDGDWIWSAGRQYRAQIEGLISLAHGMAPNDIDRAREDLLPFPNVWLGVSAEDQQHADERIPHLLATPAALRFVSAEPLLGPIDFDRGGWSLLRPLHAPPRHGPRNEGIDWVIVGGESGPGARPMHPDWVRTIRDDCLGARVPFFFKQWGEHAPNGSGRHSMIKVGTRAAGRFLDGREHNEMPSGER